MDAVRRALSDMFPLLALVAALLGQPALAQSAGLGDRIAVIVARGENVDATFTRGLALKLVVEGQRTHPAKFMSPQETRKRVPDEGDAFYSTCISDDDCLLKVCALTDQDLCLIVLVERALSRTFQARIALVSNSNGMILRRAENMTESTDRSVSSAAWSLVKEAHTRASLGSRIPVPGGSGARERGPTSNRNAASSQSMVQSELPTRELDVLRVRPTCASLDEPIPERTEAELKAPFERPWVLVLPVDDIGVKASVYRGKLTPVLDDLLQASLRFDRFRYITSCSSANLAHLRSSPPRRVEYVLAPGIRNWEEKRTATHQGHEAWSLGIEASVEVYQVSHGSLLLVGTVGSRVPEFTDSATFIAEAAARSASSVGDTLMEIKGDIKRRDRNAPRTGDAAYDEALEMFVGRLGAKLAVELKKLDAFRLEGNILSRDGDELLMAMGRAEGIGMSERFVLVPRGAAAADYVGFGRLYRLGTGGTAGAEDPSVVELIAGGEGQDLRLLEWPQLGISVEGAIGFMSYSHNGIRGPGLGLDQAGSSGAPSMTLGVGWRLPAIPITDLSIRADITLAFDFELVKVAAVPVVVEVGVEKRWSFRRFMPILGVGFDTALFLVDADAVLGTQNLGFAFASAYGGSLYTGFGIALSPGALIKLRGGYRYFPDAAGPVRIEDNVLTTTLQDSNGAPLEVRFGGPFVLASFEVSI